MATLIQLARLLSRVGFAIVALALMLVAFGQTAISPIYLLLGAALLLLDANTSRSRRGRIVDGGAGIGLLALFAAGALPLAPILCGYASLSLFADALASSELRLRYHTA
jgi:hypothetical protein